MQPDQVCGHSSVGMILSSLVALGGTVAAPNPHAATSHSQRVSSQPQLRTGMPDDQSGGDRS